MSEETELVLQAALEAIRQGRAAALATVLEARGSTTQGAGAKMLVYADGRSVGTVGGGAVESYVVERAQEALPAGEPFELVWRSSELEPGAVECGGEMRVFVEPLQSAPMILVIGAGHVGQAVAELAGFLGYGVAVLDERSELVTRERFPRASTLRVGDPAVEVKDLALNERTCVVLVTPHEARDWEVLAAFADRPTGYLGLIGSQRRTAHTFARAREAGVPDALLEQVHTPIGLDIGAQTPREIALSIMAEIVAVRRGTLSGNTYGPSDD
ncbi:MAG: XdhC/CoxI family protein [Anaerolineae bacterium]|jgi:xanthine dehydrogenase accessory factor